MLILVDFCFIVLSDWSRILVSHSQPITFKTKVRPGHSRFQFSLALVKLAFVITGCFWRLFSFWRTLSHQCHWKIKLENHRPTQFKFAPTDISVIHNARESTCLVCCRLHLKICSSTDYFNLSELANIKKDHLSSFSKLFQGL